MLWALGQPAALAGLLVAFFCSILLRHFAAQAVERLVRRFAQTSTFQPPPLRRFGLRQDVDPFGAVAAAIAGIGWARGNETATRGISLLAGPLAIIGASQLAFACYVGTGQPLLPLEFLTGMDVLRGAPGSAPEQFLLALAVGLLGCGLLTLIPLPPLDGWAMLRFARQRNETTGFAKARYWLEDQNIGVAILLGALILPLVRGAPLLLYLFDFVITPILRAWG